MEGNQIGCRAEVTTQAGHALPTPALGRVSHSGETRGWSLMPGTACWRAPEFGAWWALSHPRSQRNPALRSLQAPETDGCVDSCCPQVCLTPCRGQTGRGTLGGRAGGLVLGENEPGPATQQPRCHKHSHNKSTLVIPPPLSSPPGPCCEPQVNFLPLCEDP